MFWMTVAIVLYVLGAEMTRELEDQYNKNDPNPREFTHGVHRAATVTAIVFWPAIALISVLGLILEKYHSLNRDS